MTEDEMRDALINAWYEGADQRFAQLIARGGAKYMLLRDGCDVSAYTWILDMGVKGYPDVDEADYPCLQAVAPSEIRDQDGFHALHIATYMWHLDLVKKLIEFGATPDVESASGITPLEIAKGLGLTTIADYLATFPQRQPRQLERPTQELLAAAAKADIPKMKELLAAGANANGDEWGVCLYWKEEYTPLQLVARAKVTDEQTVEAARLLIAAGATLDRYEWDDWTALHEAASHGKPKLMRLLLEAGANPDMLTAEGWKPVEIAMRYLNDDDAIDCIQVMLDFGADLNQEKALHAATWQHAGEKAVRFLLANGADINLPDDKGRTPLDRAKEWDSGLVKIYTAAGGKTAEELKGGD